VDEIDADEDDEFRKFAFHFSVRVNKPPIGKGDCFEDVGIFGGIGDTCFRPVIECPLQDR
jgi:hypothetical protein